MNKYTVRLTEDAKLDIIGTKNYYKKQKFSIQALEKYEGNMRNRFLLLSKNPYLGQVVDHIKLDGELVEVRRLPFLNYVILYHIIGNKVHVLFVGHGKLDFYRVLKQRLR